MPVWDGKPGRLAASRTLNADQFYVHAHLTGLRPGVTHHYRVRYRVGQHLGTTQDASS